MNSTDWERKILSIRLNIISGQTDKIFDDEFFVYDLLKVLYSDDIDTGKKFELLSVLEEFACYGGVQASNVDQVIGSLLDVYQHSSKKDSQTLLSCQVLVTVTSLLIQFDQQEADACRSVTEILIAIVTGGINNAENRRIRSAACQCLLQLERWSPGSLWKEKDTLIQLMRQERTDVYQDYVLVVTVMIQNALVGPSSNGISKQDTNRHVIDRTYSVDSTEIRQLVSLIMDNTGLFTASGMWQVTLALIGLVQSQPDISPTIFKPIMLHHMATMETTMMHLVLYIQREFEKEVLTENEEIQLMERIVIGLNHPALTPAQRLFYCHWSSSFSQVSGAELSIPEFIADKYKLAFYPSVFDPIDCQLAKLCLLNICFPSLVQKEDGVAAALLLASVGYLHKLVWHTGRDRAAIALFRALFHMYHRHCSKSFSQDINRFLRGLISGFPYFIPHALDFIECMRETTPDSPVYLEILNLLHHQVVSTPENQAARYYHFYLQVLKRASLQQEISPKGTLRFLTYLAENSMAIANGSWRLGIGILAVCQNILLCHGTQSLYIEMGDLLFYMMTQYQDIDVQDRARFYYMMITSAVDEKIKSILQPAEQSQTFQQAISTLLPENEATPGYGSVVTVDEPVIEWERIKCQTETFSLSSEDSLGVSYNPDTLDHYFERLDKSKTILKFVYELKLNYVGETVYAVSINFENNDNFEPVKEIRIGRFLKSGTEEMALDVCPRKPIPSKIKTWSEFIDNKKTFRCTLHDIKIRFEDLVIPLQLQMAQLDEVEVMFDSLWRYLTKKSQSPRSSCVKSVKILHCTKDKFHKSLPNTLEKCLIPHSDSSCLKLGIFLPPKYHLLIQVTQEDDYLVVSMVTDIIDILSHFDGFLSTFDS